MTKNPDPLLELTTSKGVTRSLDDWSTMHPLCLIFLPGRVEAAAWIPVIERIFATFGDADCTCALVVAGPAEVARRILGPVEEKWLTFVDPVGALSAELGLTHLPAFVHLRHNCTVVSATVGWQPSEWQKVAREVARTTAWSVPQVSGAGDPPKSEGWPVIAA